MPLKIVIGYPGFTQNVSGGQVVFVNSEQVLATVNVAVAARAWTVQLVNPDGVASNSVNLAVSAAPAITSLAPNPMTKSAAAQTLTINGAAFAAGSGVKVVMGYPGFSTTLQGAAITSATAGQLKATVDLGNVARAWTVQVVNPNGAASAPISLNVK